MPQLRLALFGGCTVTMDGERAGSPLSTHAQALLAYLAVNRDTTFTRHALGKLFWPDVEESVAATNLQAAIAEVQNLLNQRLYDAPPFLLANQEQVTLNPASSISVDTIVFENHLYAVNHHQHRKTDACPQCIQNLSKAAALYTGPFLAGIVVDSEVFELWRHTLCEQYGRQALGVLDTLCSHYQLVGEFESLVDCARKQLTLDPWRESAHIYLVKSLLSLGELDSAKAYVVSLRQKYREAFNQDVPTALVEAYLTFQKSQGLADNLSDESTTMSREKVTAMTLPQLGMPIIGREAELMQLSDWLSEDIDQCIVLMGPGGVGKTHLAVAAAESTRGSFANGIAYYALPEMETSRGQASEHPLDAYQHFMMNVMQEALGMTPGKEFTDVQHIFDQLNDREFLFIVDNAERCPAAVTYLIDRMSLLAPRMTVLICSRRHIDFRNARVLEVSPLPFPQQTDRTLAEDYASIRLFNAYAQKYQPKFALTEETMPAVIDICQQLEGLPLGLVLAASWVANFSVRQIADAVKTDLSVLVSTSPFILQRHQSLQSVFEESWHLLSASEQKLLVKLAVFRGGFDMSAAVAIVKEDGNIEEILGLLLKNGFLIEVNQGRYDLPRIVQQYVMNTLALADEDGCEYQIHFRYACYYLNPDAWKKDGVGFDSDIQNIRHAWQWAAARGEIATFYPGLMGWIQLLERRGRFQEGSTSSEILIWRLKYRDDIDAELSVIQYMIGHLYVSRGHFLTMLGKYTEASEVIQHALNLAVTSSYSSLESEVQLAWGILMVRQGDYSAAQTRLTQALQQAQNLENTTLTQQSMYHLGIVTMHQNDFTVAQMYLRQSLELAQCIQDGYREGEVLNALGFLALSLGLFTEARQYLQNALQCFEKEGSLWGKGITQQNMGYVENSLGMYEEARTWFEQALFTNRECGNLFGEAKALTSLGLLFYHQNDYQAAHKACRQAYDFTRQLGDRVIEAEVLTAWGHVYAAQDETIEAAAAYQKALELRQELGQRAQGVEATAGLVHLALKEDAAKYALPFVEKILDRIRLVGDLKGAQQPFWVDWVCYRALIANDDPRASQVLERAYNALMSQVKNLENGAERKSFLSNVVSHREIVKLYEQNSIKDGEEV